MKAVCGLGRAGTSRLNAIIGLWLLLLASWTEAAVIEGINFSSLPGGRFEIRLDFDGQPVEPQGYVVESPARIVLDFEQTQSALSEKKYPLSFDNADSLVVLSAGERTRMIVNLNSPVPYEVTMGTNSLSLLVENSVAAADVYSSGVTSARPSSDVSGDSGSGQNSVRDVDFKRGENGEGIISIMLANSQTPLDVTRKGSTIVLSLYRTDLPDALDRKLDVGDFATPVRHIDSVRDGGTTAISIEADGEFDYLAYQTDNKYVVSIQPLTTEELEDQQAKFAFSGEKLSLNFQDIEVRSVLQLIADFTDLNLVASDTVTGSITLRLQNVPWDQALDIILRAKGLDKRQQGNVLMVAPTAEITEQERALVEANKQSEELAPLVTEFIRVRYADAGKLFDLFDVDEGGGGGDEEGGSTSSILSERGSAIVDERTNTIVLTDIQAKIDEFRILIKALDIPIQQVEIEARIVFANTDFRKEMGVRWGVSGIRGSDDNGLIFSGDDSGLLAGPRSITRDGSGDLTGTDPTATVIHTNAVDLGASESFSNLALGLIKDNTFIELELSAMESDGFGEIVSQPKVITGDKQEATIKSGTQIPFQSGTSSGETDVEFKEAVLQLRVTPQITPDNRIILDLKINQDTVGELVVPTAGGGSVPTIDVTEVQTQVLIGDGQTLVLGGIFQMESFDSVRKVPVLGDLPYIGKLFKSTLKNTGKREILIFVTPRLISDSLLDR
jgi:type IV pilus assembly protein PilQ